MQRPSSRDARIKRLAKKFAVLMRQHSDRVEAIDAYDMARILFRRPSSIVRFFQFLTNPPQLGFNLGDVSLDLFYVRSQVVNIAA